MKSAQRGTSQSGMLPIDSSNNPSASYWETTQLSIQAGARRNCANSTALISISCVHTMPHVRTKRHRRGVSGLSSLLSGAWFCRNGWLDYVKPEDSSMNVKNSIPSSNTRREFLKTSAAAVAGTGLASAFAPPVHAAGSDTLKIALIGCGSRGTSALGQALSTQGSVKLWALADAFSNQLEGCLNNAQRQLNGEKTERRASRKARRPVGNVADKIDVPKERQFVGLDAYRKAIDSGVDVVLLAEPPGYRPQH